MPGEVWDGTGDNPYFAYLALADALLVTADSVSMVSEAAATGKPVQYRDRRAATASSPGFTRRCARPAITRPFAGAIEQLVLSPPDDTARAGAALRALVLGP